MGLTPKPKTVHETGVTPNQRFVSSQLRVATDFIGIAGNWSYLGNTRLTKQVARLTPGTPCQLGSTPSPNTVYQILNPNIRIDQPLISDTDEGSVITTWAGPVWRVSPSNNIESFNEVCACQRILTKALKDRDFTVIKQIEGDFVAALVSHGQVLLVRSLESTMPLFYKMRGQSIEWSTNFMDLVDDPFETLDHGALAVMGLGLSRPPYPDIQSILPGRYLHFTDRGFKHGKFDAYQASLTNRRLTLEEWAEIALKTCRCAVAKRAKPYRKIGLMQGGVDSSAVARCLVDSGADVTLYNWASPTFPPADESFNARKVAQYLGIPLREINIGDYRHSNSHFLGLEWRFSIPYVHTLYSWWDEVIEHMKADGIECIMSGDYAEGVFANDGLILSKDILSLGLSKGAKLFWHSLSLDVPTPELLSTLLPETRLRRANRIDKNMRKDRSSRLTPVTHYTDQARDIIEKNGCCG